ncbi:hypothetical protein DMV94_05000 [Vibrio parahaemolyticus]|nr:hypothetical protein CO725_05185 [Vibrio parahaemolyticus]EGR2841806.1 hypothetical protein [Vibrio parahaemolyticus]EGR3039413.1 hypothetical protein [Vibrio parahaemolyticus]TBT90226.1 hypothetical protein D5E71_00840 [Vibrio parahaemolyticus]TOJ31396.1 hypothetical protein CGI43_00805 [Vibrio parahaemolyticus]
MVTSRFRQKARPSNTSNETKDQRQGKFFHPNDKNEATKSNMKSSKNNFASFSFQRDKIDYLTSSEHKLTAMLRNKPIAYLANNRYVFIGTEYYF